MPRLAPNAEELGFYIAKLRRLSIEWRRLSRLTDGGDIKGENPRFTAAQFWIDVIEIGDLEDFRFPLGWPDGLRAILERIRGEQSFYPDKLDELERLIDELETIAAPLMDADSPGKTVNPPCPESIDAEDEKDNRRILRALYGLKAFDDEPMAKKGDIKLKVGPMTCRRYDAVMKRLKDRHLMTTGPGSKGGARLTPLGKDLARSLAH
jgi:hypothetical protein